MEGTELARSPISRSCPDRPIPSPILQLQGILAMKTAVDWHQFDISGAF